MSNVTILSGKKGVICAGCGKLIEEEMIERRVLDRFYHRIDEETGDWLINLEETNMSIVMNGVKYNFHDEQCLNKLLGTLYKLCGNMEGRCRIINLETKEIVGLCCYFYICKIFQILNLILKVAKGEITTEEENIEMKKKLGIYLAKEDKRFCPKCGVMLHKDYIEEHVKNCVAKNMQFTFDEEGKKVAILSSKRDESDL